MKRQKISGAYMLLPALKRTLLCLSIVVFFSECKKAELPPADSSTEQSTKTTSAGTSATPDFTVVVLPDTQYYTHPNAPNHPGGNVAMLQAQIDWVRANRASENIVFVAGVGDIVNHANEDFQWTNAKNCFYRLEPPTTLAYTNNDGVSMPHGIPYGLAVGNHDQYPSQDPSGASTSKYNAAFGVSRFQGRTSYYGGHYGSNNDSHFDLFSVGTGADKIDFIVIFIEYSNGYDWANVHAWVNTTLQTYSSRKAIIVSHNIANLNTANDWSEEGQGLAIYNAIKNRQNVFMMACGHVTQEHVREDLWNGNRIRTYLCDYQGLTNGGDGYMRVMKFSPSTNTVSVRSISPYRQNNGQTPWEYTDANSKFTKPIFNAPAPPATLANGKYKITSALTGGKSIAIYNATLQDYGTAVLWDFGNPDQDNDEWVVTKLSNGYYTIKNEKSQKHLVIISADHTAGADAVQYPYAAGGMYNDEWSIVDAGGGYYKIVARHSEMVLNVEGAVNANGTQIIQYPYTDVPQSKWQFTIVP